MEKPDAKVHLGLAGVQIAFGTFPVVGKIVMNGIGPMALAFARLAGAAIFVILASRIFSTFRAIDKQDRIKLAFIVILGLVANQLLYLAGLKRTQALHASALITTIPAFAMLFAMLLRHEQKSLKRIVGVGIALSGALAIAGVKDLTLGYDTLLGDVMILVNAACYGLYLVLVRRYVRKYGSLNVLAFGFPVALIATFPFAATELTEMSLSLHQVGLVIYLILVVTVFPYLTNAWALTKGSSSMVAVYIFLQPVIGTVLATIFLHEELDFSFAVGAAAIFLGIILVTRSNTSATIRRSYSDNQSSRP